MYLITFFLNRGNRYKIEKRTFRQNCIYFVFFDTFVAVFHVYNGKMNKNWAKMMILHIVPAVSLRFPSKKTYFRYKLYIFNIFSLSYCFFMCITVKMNKN